MSIFLNDNILFTFYLECNYIIQYKSNFIRIINKNTNEIFQSYIKYNSVPFISYRKKPFNLCQLDVFSNNYFNYYNYYCNNLPELEETLEIIFHNLETITIYDFFDYILVHFYSISDYDFYLNIYKIL